MIGTNTTGEVGSFGNTTEVIAGYLSNIQSDGMVQWKDVGHFYSTSPGQMGNYGYHYEQLAGYYYFS
jgi:hypothetical protein